jgi:alkylation response protein AidB-like acyl-CoA dehydrogenase
LFSYALSEADAGPDAAGMKTRAIRDRDWWVLNGKRTVVPAGPLVMGSVRKATRWK